MAIGILEEWRIKGVEQGLEKGRQETQSQLLADLLQTRFGELTPLTQARIAALSREEARKVIKTVWTAQSLADLGLEPPAGV